MEINRKRKMAFHDQAIKKCRADEGLAAIQRHAENDSLRSDLPKENLSQKKIRATKRILCPKKDDIVSNSLVMDLQTECKELRRRLAETEQRFKNLSNVRRTKPEKALEELLKDMKHLERSHSSIKTKFEAELKRTRANLENSTRELITKTSHGLSLRERHVVKGTAGKTCDDDVQGVVRNFQTLTGLQVVPDIQFHRNLNCTVLCRAAKRGVKFVISLPSESEPGCQYIPRANTHLLPGHLRDPLEFDEADIPVVVSEIINAVFES